MPVWSDEEIWRGMRDPERRPRAFAALHGQFGPRVLGFLTKMCHGDRDRAEDLLGRALYKSYLGLARMEEPCRSLPGWIYTVAARTALDEFDRENPSDPLRASLPLHDELLEAPLAGAEPVGGETAVDEAVAAVLDRLDTEDPRYRALLEMEHIGACDRGEIADATGIPRKQIAQYLKRARQRFTRLAREYPALAAFEEVGRRGEAA
jgi:RNA polymerase sigma factor (sigma-70 family)